MNKLDFINSNEVLFFDGAFGSLAIERGLNKGLTCLLNITNKADVINIHKEYINAGINFITTNTFLANNMMLENTNYTVTDIVASGINNAKIAISESKSDKCLIAQSISMCGKFLSITDSYTFDVAYNLFKEQVIIGETLGVDLFLLETFMDLKELESAILACKENSSKPIFATMTFRENGKTFFGTDPKAFAILCEEYGVEAIGINCMYGEKLIASIIKEIKSCCSLKIIVQPNRDKPEKTNTTPVYNISKEQFLEQLVYISKVGVNYIGGCCGTTPEFIDYIIKSKNLFN